MIESGGLFTAYCATRIILLFFVSPSLFQCKLLELLKKCRNLCTAQFLFIILCINSTFPICVATFLATRRCIGRNESAALCPSVVIDKVIKILPDVLLIYNFCTSFFKVMDSLGYRRRIKLPKTLLPLFPIPFIKIKNFPRAG